MKVYLATSLNEEYRENTEKIVTMLRERNIEVYYPLEHQILNAWDYPNHEWGLMVFTNDVEAIQQADLVIMLSYGRISTAGANWEAGFAFGKGKKVLVVYMNEAVQSLMVANGRYATVRDGLRGLEMYLDNTDNFEHLYPAREGATIEQK